MKTVVEASRPAHDLRVELDATTRFWNAPEAAYFDQRVIAAVLSSSEAKLERDRWLGVGLPYSRHGRRILYKKADVLALLERNRTVL